MLANQWVGLYCIYSVLAVYGEAAAAIFFLVAIGAVGGVGFLCGVQGNLALDAIEQFLGHIGKHIVLIDKAGMAAMGWNGYAIENGCGWRSFAKAPIGVLGIFCYLGAFHCHLESMREIWW